jgi:outer membrane biosynthesis protein TonB
LQNKGQYDPKPWNIRLNALLDTTKTNPTLYHMPSSPSTAPYDLIASSDQSISNTLQYTRSLSHTVFWASFAGPTLYASITAAAIAATQVCAPDTLKTGDKEDKVSMACLADWRSKGPERRGQEDDKSVLAAAAALEAVQGVLWGMPKGEAPKPTNKPEDPKQTVKPEGPKQTKKPEESKPQDPKQTQKPQDPKQTSKPEDPRQTSNPEDPKQMTKAMPQPTQINTLEQPRSSQTSGTSEVSPSVTTSGEAKPSETAGSASRTRFGWLVAVSAGICAALIV